MMGSGSRRSSTTQGMDGAPTTELEQQIADILLSKRGRRGSRDDSGDVSRFVLLSYFFCRRLIMNVFESWKDMLSH